MKAPIKVMVVDDHELVRVGIARLLGEDLEIKIVAAVGNGEEAVRSARDKLPDVILLDVGMPGIGSLEVVHKLRRLLPQTKIIILSAGTPDLLTARLLQAGAVGYITKEESLTELVKAVKLVYTGQRYIAPKVANQIALMSISETKATSFGLLTDRELQIVLMVVQGLPVQAIAEKLHLSSKTINSYRYSIFEKLNIYNDVQLTLIALEHGFIERPYCVE